MMKTSVFAVAVLVGALVVGGCTTNPRTGQKELSNTGKGALIGGAGGAAIGAIAGGGTGAAIGAGAGAATGALIGTQVK